jgi:D-alanyl-D-alanine carboxypeptidase
VKRTRQPSAPLPAQATIATAATGDPPPKPAARPAARPEVEGSARGAGDAPPRPSGLPKASGTLPAFQIQIGAFSSQGQAERRLASVRQLAGALLAKRAGLTTEVRRGRKVLYRARYAGFDGQAAAAGVCDALKRLKVECQVVGPE